MHRLASLAFALAIAAAACTSSEPPSTTSFAPTSLSTAPSDGGESTTSTTEGTTDSTTGAVTGDPIVIVVDAIRAVALVATVERFTAETGVPVILEVQEFDAIRDRADDPDVDIFIGPHTWRDELIDNGVISAIDDLGPDQWSTQAAAAFTTRDGMVAVPFSAESLVLYVGDAFGPPPDDLLAPCPTEAVPCLLLPGLGAAGGYHMTPFLMADADRTLPELLSDPASMSAGLGAFKQVTDSDHTAIVSLNEARSAFETGTMLFIGGPWDLGRIEDSDVGFSVVPLPAVGGLRLAAPLSVQGFYLSATAPQSRAAASFLIEYLSLAEPQRDLWLRDRRAPVHVELDDLGVVAAAFAAGVDEGFLLPQGDLAIYWEELGAAASAIYADVDPLDALAAAAVRIDDRIGLP